MNKKTEILDLEEILDRNDRAMALHIKTLRAVGAKDLGLDPRAGSNIYIDPNGALIIKGDRDRRILDYYGGFEYVDKEFITVLGEYTIYHAKFGENERVQSCFDYYEEMGNSNDSEDQD